MSCLYLHEILSASVFTSAFHISHGLIDSLIRYSVFKVQTAFMLRKHFVRLKQFGVGFAGKPASSRAFALRTNAFRKRLVCYLRTRNLRFLVLDTIQMFFAFPSGIRRQVCMPSLMRKRLLWRLRDSNSRPPACKAGALPTELSPHSIRQPPAFPYRLQYSIIGRLGLNHRVRDENGCLP